MGEVGFRLEVGDGGLEDSSVVFKVNTLDPLHVNAAKFRRRPLLRILLQIILKEWKEGGGGRGGSRRMSRVEEEN